MEEWIRSDNMVETKEQLELLLSKKKEEVIQLESKLEEINNKIPECGCDVELSTIVNYCDEFIHDITYGEGGIERLKELLLENVLIEIFGSRVLAYIENCKERIGD